MKCSKKRDLFGVMRRVLAGESGAGLVIALLALVVLSILGLAFLTISKTESDISLNDRDASRALYIADAGLDRFKRDLRYDCTYPGTNTSDQYLASPAPVADGTLEDTTGTYVKASAPVKRYYDLGAPLLTSASDPPAAGFWSSVSPVSAYQQRTLNGGSYALKLAKSQIDAFFVLSTGSVGTRGERAVEAKVEAKNLSVWDNAIFGGTGASGAVINGNVTVAGSVHVLGTGLSSTDSAITMGGGATILNQYTGISSTLNGKLVEDAAAIAARPGKLRAEFRVKRGKTMIESGSSGVGEWGCYLKGVYTNDGFGGSNPNNVYSDNGKNMKYDLPPDVPIPFPMPDNAWLSANSMNIAGSLTPSGADTFTLDADTPSFSVGPDALGNSIAWNQTTGTLTFSGIFKIPGTLNLAKKSNVLYYHGKGTLYATNDVYMKDCVLPDTSGSFPSTNNIGIISGNNIDMDCNVAQVRHAGAFYAQNRIVMAKQDQIAGSIVTNYFDLGSQVPSIFQVPLLGKNLPPGMPGSDPYYFIKTVYWREVTS